MIYETPYTPIVDIGLLLTRTLHQFRVNLLSSFIFYDIFLNLFIVTDSVLGLSFSLCDMNIRRKKHSLYLCRTQKCFCNVTCHVYTRSGSSTRMNMYLETGFYDAECLKIALDAYTRIDGKHALCGISKISV